MKRILFITADFDEKELSTKLYDNLDDFVQDRTWWTSYKSMADYVEEHGYDASECEGPEKMIMELVKDGFYVDEWHSYELYEGDFNIRGIANV